MERHYRWRQGAKREVAPTSPKHLISRMSGEIKEGPANRRDYEDRSNCVDITPDIAKEKPGPEIMSMPPSRAYEKGWERIFGKSKG